MAQKIDLFNDQEITIAKIYPKPKPDFIISVFSIIIIVENYFLKTIKRKGIEFEIIWAKIAQ